MAPEDIESGSPGERLAPQRETEGPQSRFLHHISCRGVPLQRHLIAVLSGAARGRLDDLSDAALPELKSRLALANPGCATGSRRAIDLTRAD
jgi:hypothetical protein